MLQAAEGVRALRLEQAGGQALRLGLARGLSAAAMAVKIVRI